MPTTTTQTPQQRRLFLLLRLGAAACFVGHGAFGLIGKEAWLPYFAVAGIGPDAARWLMPVVGAVDVAAGVLILVRPMRSVLLYMTLWAVWTALLRPLAGESAFETLERAGNYGVPFALLLWVGWSRRWRAWFTRLTPPPLDDAVRGRLATALVATTALLLIGHGGLGLFENKALLTEHWSLLGLPPGTTPVVGGAEIVLAIALALAPARPVLIFAALWKLATEALFPLAGAPVWEFVERGGSYVAPLAAAVLAPAALLAARRAESGVRAGLTGLAVLLAAAPLQGTPHPDRHAFPSADTVREPVSTVELLAALRAGELVLACRHAITDRSRGDRHPIDLDDRATQRNLSAAGEHQARALGEEIRQLDLPIGEVLASPLFRTRESARIAFGREAPVEALRIDRDSDFTDLLRAPPRDGNRVLMTHIGRLLSTLRVVDRAELDEGDCAAVRPTGDGFTVLGTLSLDDWRRLR